MNDHKLPNRGYTKPLPYEDNSTTKKECCNCMSNITNAITLFLENTFAKFGHVVGSHPYKTIFISVVFSLICVIGIMRHEQESRGEKLWVDQDSKFIEDQKWVRKQFPINKRNIDIMLERSNVLTSEGLQQLLQIDKLVKGIYENSTNIGLRWENISYNEPAYSLLELWSFNETLILNVTPDQIIDKLNTNKAAQVYSPIRKSFVNVSSYISSIVGNSTHQVVSARIAKLSYFIKKQDVLDTSVGRWKDELGTEWEIEFARVFKSTIFTDAKAYYSTLQSFLQGGLDAIGNDFGLLFTGYALIIAYVAIQLGKFSSLQHKVWLSIAGIICVGMAVGVSYGLCAACGVIYGPVHSVLPFLLLGIGVDDIFVIIQTWDNCAGDIFDSETIAKKISKTMQHAGVAITVTSFTDFFAFLIGATTVLPALRSFCIYAGVGILMLYIFASSFFVAFLTIDARRQRQKREACCGCQLSDTWQPFDCSKQFYLKQIISSIGNWVITVPGKIIVILITAVILGFGFYGLLQLNQDFDPDWFLPPDSDEILYRNAYRKYFPGDGIDSAVYIGEIDYYKEQHKLHELYNTIQNDFSILNYTVTSWYNEYILWMKKDHTRALYVVNDTIQSKSHFYTNLRQFINDNINIYGSSFNYNPDTNNQLLIKASRFYMKHKNINGTNNQIKAMDSIRKAVENIAFTSSSQAFAFTDRYINWQTNRIIGEELVRNLTLAAVCVFLVTFLLIANLRASLMVLTCVAFTIIDICGYMYFWDLSIDTIISTILVIALGFAVDYAAHIGHAFMASSKGDLNERSKCALVEIGPAVLHGGVSTFLAFCLLAGSESYAFQTFFKLFFLVVSIGLWHGLVYLPVILSILGPPSYKTSVINAHCTTNEIKSNDVIMNPKPIDDINHTAPATIS